MDIATLLGIVSGIGLIGWALAANGDFSSFIDVPSIAITVGGTLAATFINFRHAQLTTLIKVTKQVFTTPRLSPAELISTLVGFAERARREGLLALEEEAEALADPFMRRGVQLVVDGTDPELVRNVLETELTFLQDRHRQGQTLFQSMGQMAPAFGMIGTLIGLVQMLRNLDRPEAIGPGLAVALLTTFYGSLLANLFFLPMAGKLRVSSEEEVLLREMTIEGVLSIQAGDNPRLVEEKLRAFLSPAVRAELDAKKQAAQAGPAREEITA